MRTPTLTVLDTVAVPKRNGGLASTAVAPRRRAVLAEDDVEMRSLLATTLRREGFEVMEAADGRELGRLVHSLIFAGGDPDGVDLIVSDIRMPGPDGLTVLSRLRRYDWATPVVIITAFGDAATHDEAIRLGAMAVLDKPFDLDDFRTLLRNFEGWTALHARSVDLDALDPDAP
jgi:DNA-binding NtrC family response regulator